MIIMRVRLIIAATMIYFIRTKLDPNFRSAQFIIISFIELNIATIYLQVRSLFEIEKKK
jgi:hypothetical protein